MLSCVLAAVTLSHVHRAPPPRDIGCFLSVSPGRCRDMRDLAGVFILSFHSLLQLKYVVNKARFLNHGYRVLSGPMLEAYAHSSSMPVHKVISEQQRLRSF
jgi:hypothetical protein